MKITTLSGDDLLTYNVILIVVRQMTFIKLISEIKDLVQYGITYFRTFFETLLSD